MKVINFSIFLFILSSCSLFKTATPEEIAANSKLVNEFFEKKFNENIMKYPTWQTYLGMKTDYGKLNDNSEEFSKREHEYDKKVLKEVRELKSLEVDRQTELSLKLFEQSLENSIEDYQWRYHGFPVNQMFGFQSQTPAFMINMHTVENKEHAEAYISRLKEIKRVFGENIEFMKKQESKGIIPPKFVFEKVIDDSEKLIKGRPFDGSRKDSALLEDFKKKVNALKISSKEKRKLKSQAIRALMDYVKPSYDELIAYVKELEKKANKNEGAWSLPNGEEYYKVRLARITTTEMSAEEIHSVGLKEVERIHGEMKMIMKKTGFKGNLQAFFEFMKTSPKFTYPNNQKGRKTYLRETKKIIANMKKSLPKMFNTLPKADLEVKAVEAFREKSAGIAFYQRPSLVGNRPGKYYVNLYKMEDVSKYEMEALAYHEALPGHHMQLAIAIELEGLPKFRRTGGYTAYTEGWGLYSELLPKQFGFYEDPYSDFGRLSMELWRACRLVVDTGIHHYKWTREKSIDYLKNNTPNGELEIVKGVERYFVMPAQATAYKIGMMKFLELREKAKAELGEKFDLKVFHDVVLRDGALPLNIVEENVMNWVEKAKKI